MNAQIKALHETYCRLTGLTIRLSYDRHRAWFDFLQAGFSPDDLALVISYLKKGIAQNDRNPGALKFHNLVQQLDYFEEDLAMARKPERPRPAPEPRQQTVGDTTRQLDAAAPEKSPEEISQLAQEQLTKLAALKTKIRSNPKCS